MGYPDEEGVLAFLSNGNHNANMAITFFGTLNSFNRIQRTPSRIPISVNSYREKERKPIDRPGRDKERSPHAQDYDLRYVDRLKIWKDRPLCPMLEERFERHLLEKHTIPTKKQGVQCSNTDSMQRNSVTTNTMSETLLSTILDEAGSSDNMKPNVSRSPDLGRKGYDMNRKRWSQNSNFYIDDRNNNNDYPNYGHGKRDFNNTFDDNSPTKLKSFGQELNNNGRNNIGRNSNGMIYDNNENTVSNDAGSSEYNANRQNNMNYNNNAGLRNNKHQPNAKAFDNNYQNSTPNDAGFGKGHNLNNNNTGNNNNMNYSNNANHNTGLSNNKHQQYAEAYDNNYQNSTPNDGGSGKGHNVNNINTGNNNNANHNNNLNNNNMNNSNNANHNTGLSNNKYQPNTKAYDNNYQNSTPYDAGSSKGHNVNNNNTGNNINTKSNATNNNRHKSRADDAGPSYIRHQSEPNDTGHSKDLHNKGQISKYSRNDNGNPLGNPYKTPSRANNLNKGNNNKPNNADFKNGVRTIGSSDVVPSNGIPNHELSLKPNRASFNNDGQHFQSNKTFNDSEHKKYAAEFLNTNDGSESLYNLKRKSNDFANKEELRPDAYPFNCSKQYTGANNINMNNNNNNIANSTKNYTRNRFNNNTGTTMEFHNDNGSTSKSNNFANRSNANNNNTYNHSIPLKRTDTRDLISPTRNIYSDYLQTEIREWLQDVPIYLNSADDREDIIMTLTAKINNLCHECNCEQYERNFKFVVDQVLSSLPLWYPGQKSDQILFKNNLTDNLYNKVKELNKKLVPTNNASYSDRYNVNRVSHVMNNRFSLTGAAEEEISKWVQSNNLPLQFDNATITKTLLKKLLPLLRSPVSPSTSKFNLKCAIAEVLNDLIASSNGTSNMKDMQLYKSADDLATGLLAIQSRHEKNIASQSSLGPCVESCAAPCAQETSDEMMHSKLNQNTIYREINKCLCSTNFVFQEDIKIAITNIVTNYLDSQLYVGEFDTKKEIILELHRYCVPEDVASYIAEDIINEVKITFNQFVAIQTKFIPTITSEISVYTSEDKSSIIFPVTSTPKKQRMKEISKLNPEEIEYEDKVTNLIRNWMETLPEFAIDDEENEFKEIMIKDLAGEIIDQAKLEQIAKLDDEDNFRKYIVYRWVNKMNVFDINEIKDQIENFLLKLKDISVPALTRPQHGNRQAMAQLRENYENYQELHLPKATDILEDEISIWMNEQPDILDTDRDTRSDKIHEIAEVLHDKLSKECPEEEIATELAQWLDGMVTPQQKDNVDQLAADLKNRVINLPQDETLAANLEKKEQERIEFFEEKDKKKKCCRPVEFKTTDEDTIIVDKTMRQFISKYIEHNYDVDDPLARGAFSRLLKTKLQRLNPPTSKEAYNKVGKTGISSLLPRGKLIRELDYIKDVSDWLKFIAVAPSFNTIGNRNRIDFVIDLAHNIFEIEEERDANPNALDYNMYLASVIGQFLDHIPLEKEHHNVKYLNFIMKQLLAKIVAHRNKNYNAINKEESIDTSGINDDNVGDFIEEFILVNGSDIAHDELKLEAWSVRLLDEIKKMVHENADTPTKGQVYNQLLDVPKPGDETMQQFETEIEYIKEISQWLKNFPLSPLNNTEKEERIKMISDLTEKVTERDNMKLNNPNDSKAESDFAEYIAKWIANLSLDESREVVVAVVIQQLLNRIEKVKRKNNNSISTLDSAQPFSIENDAQSITKDDTDSIVNDAQPIKNYSQSCTKGAQPAVNDTDSIVNDAQPIKNHNQSSTKDAQPAVNNTDSIVNDAHPIKNDTQPITNHTQTVKSPTVSDDTQTTMTQTKKSDRKAAKALPSNKSVISPATAMVDSIEKWSKSLPITGDEKEVNSLKNDASKKLYQTVGELNIDPRTFNDDLLYKNMLVDEVDAVIEALPQNPELENRKEQLRNELVDNIVEAQKAIKEHSAGEQYKHRLEHTIEASMPHPVKNRQFDPGFEIYKARLADMFILENFDHANDVVKVKYEKSIKDEIDKYYKSVKNKNVIPLTNDEIYNELYSALYKVPVPNEKSVIGEVEEIKTRCVIDMWYEKLPLIETSNVSELLERDRILATMAKRIHEIEGSESDRTKRKEIIKWLGKLPLQPGQEKNIGSLAKKLEKELKASANQRKCMTTDPVKSNKNKKIRKSDKSKDGKEGLPGTAKTKLKKKAVDYLMTMVENWCLSLPIYSNRPQNSANDNMLKDNLVTTIMIKLCELNMDPTTFNDDVLHDKLLDEELDNLLRSIPTSCNFDKIKEVKKQQLKDAVRSIKPIFKEEKAKHQYNQNLENTVARVLGISENMPSNKEAQLRKLKDEIVENFVLYTYDKGDDEERQAYKIQIHNAVVKFLAENKSEGKDSLMLRNKLMCELAKVPIPGKDVLKEDVEEIRMKNDINEFFQEQAIYSNDDKMDQLKCSLAIKLNELELDGYNPENEAKMKQEITKHLKNLNKDVKPQAIDKFVNKLKNDEAVRRAPAKVADPCLKDGCKAGIACKENLNKDVKPQAIDKFVNKLKNDEAVRRAPAKVADPCLKDGCKAGIACKDISHTDNIPLEIKSDTCLDHCRNKSDTKTVPNHETRLNNKDRNKGPLATASERSLSDSSGAREDYCKCKICDCAREIQKLTQGRTCYLPMRFCPRNKEKIPFCMPAGYYYF